jgi:hypothetical protein
MTGQFFFFRKSDIWTARICTVIFLKILRNQFSCPYKIIGKITVSGLKILETADEKKKCSQLTGQQELPEFNLLIIFSLIIF